ncbi:hypothetical protein AGLY_003841 [Aphis glycines]|uniref:Uncharacterized protein n=1 Tax=Aphis glycines TaxID=307491 RepID=A0A6G0U1P5_APHGL|nr:hypothetical protein AGLY_003841 [Aphis glycines]
MLLKVCHSLAAEMVASLIYKLHCCNLKNIQPNVHQLCQLHKVCKTKKVQHQNRVSCDLKITLLINKDSDNTFCVDWNSLPRLIMILCGTLQHQVVVSILLYFKQYSQIQILDSFWYSAGNGLKYHVSISYFPNCTLLMYFILVIASCSFSNAAVCSPTSNGPSSDDSESSAFSFSDEPFAVFGSSGLLAFRGGSTSMLTEVALCCTTIIITGRWTRRYHYTRFDLQRDGITSNHEDDGIEYNCCML